MPVITTGLYQVILEQNYRGQAVLNSFFYEENLGNDDEQELCATAFDEDIMATLALAQHTSLIYNSIRVRNVTGNLADFLLTPTIIVGQLIGTAINSFTAAGIRLNRTTKETRNGQKRIAGQTEEVAETQTWQAAYIDLLDDLGDVLILPITTVGGVFNPVIARQSIVTPTDWTVNPIASFTANNFITSQTSRKA